MVQRDALGVWVCAPPPATPAAARDTRLWGWVLATHTGRASQWQHMALPQALATVAHLFMPFRIQAGPPASLALAMLPPPGRGGELRFPSGAGRRIREIEKGMRGS